MRQRYNDNTKRPKPKENQAGRDLKNLCILPENSAEDLGSRRVLLVLCIYDNAPKKLPHLPPKSSHDFT